jgi:hypothetical protein
MLAENIRQSDFIEALMIKFAIQEDIEGAILFFFTSMTVSFLYLESFRVRLISTPVLPIKHSHAT